MEQDTITGASPATDRATRTGTATDTDTDTDTAAADTSDRGDASELVDELLIEEISIDGMCGVY